MEDLGKYTRRTELYKLSAEEQTEKMKLVMKEVEKISAYTGVSEEAAYNLFLNGNLSSISANFLNGDSPS